MSTRLTQSLLRQHAIISLGVAFFFSAPLFAWNALGHLLVAQIAYDQLTPQERQFFQQDNRRLHPSEKDNDLVKSAIWLDHLRAFKWNHEMRALGKLHYIGLPYSRNDSFHSRMNKMNAVMAVNMAQNVLNDVNSDALDRTIAVRILWHVVGDLHQPMHCIKYMDIHYPHGDQGGNLYRLGTSAVSKNLHAYWDMGGGLLVRKKHKVSQKEMKLMAKALETRWPCQASQDLNAQHWASESYHLAVDVAYLIPEYTVPTDAYQQKAASISEERIALAGCRLAAVSKQIYARTNLRRAQSLNHSA